MLYHQLLTKIRRRTFQILRIQAPLGTKRLEIAENACLRDLFESVHSLFDLPNFEFSLFKERNNKDEVTQHNNNFATGSPIYTLHSGCLSSSWSPVVPSTWLMWV